MKTVMSKTYFMPVEGVYALGFHWRVNSRLGLFGYTRSSHYREGMIGTLGVRKDLALQRRKFYGK